MVDWLFSLNPMPFNLLLAAYILVVIICGARVAVRAGRTPAFALLLLVPILQTVVVIAFALVRWPFVDGEADKT